MQTDALLALREKVAAGLKSPTRWTAFAPFNRKTATLAFCAYHSSLDAAHALHKAVLPEWWYIVSFGFAGEGAYVRLGNGAEEIGAADPDPARAWLLAQLDALIFEAETP